jgi:hypothetical protein
MADLLPGVTLATADASSHGSLNEPLAFGLGVGFPGGCHLLDPVCSPHQWPSAVTRLGSAHQVCQAA